MKPEEFCTWLQGFAELHDGTPSDAQWRSIREHLQTVFHKVTPLVDHEKPVKPFPKATPKQIDEAMKKMQQALTDEDFKKSLAQRVSPYTPTSLRLIC